jgi:predicted NAD/FAD-dependent oxidoreductase
MEHAFEHIISLTTELGEVRFTARAELVSRETGIERPTMADIRKWLEANPEAAVNAAILWRLAHPVHAIGADGRSTWDGIVRLGLDDYPPS